MTLPQPQSKETLLPLESKKLVEADAQQKNPSPEYPPIVDFVPEEEEYFDFQI